MPNHYERPSGKLAVELDEVKDDAMAVVDYVQNLNVPLPKEFPKAQLIRIASLMFELPDCTAYGCREPLLFAQEKLAALRSEHIPRDESPSPEASEDESPRLLRREPLDARITALMSSVSTALQAVNREVAADPEIATRPDVGIETPRDELAKRVGTTVRKGQRALTTQRYEFDEIRAEGSENADRLRRRLTDALSLNQLAGTELAMQRVVPAWLVRVGNSLREYPKLIIAASAAVKVSADIADWAHDKWTSYNDKLFKVGVELVREVSVDISRYGHELERRRTQRQPIQSHVEEFSEDRARDLLVAGMPIPSSWELAISNLNLESTDFADLSVLRNLLNLESLRLGYTQISDLSPLIELKKLRLLELSGTKVENLGPLGFLTELTRLDLDGSQVSRITPLSNLKNLRRLDLSRTRVRDIKPIADLYELRYLDLSRTRVSDITPLRRLDHLFTLDVSFTQVGEIVSLALLRELTELHLTGTKVKESDLISARSFLTRLHNFSPP